MVALAAGALALVTDVWGVRSILQSLTHPELEVVYFQREGDRLSLARDGIANLQIDAKDIFANRVQLPLNLAVRNRGETPLDVVRVEIEYPDSLDVTPAGRPKIDPTETRLIYEHDIGLLEPIGEYTPLATIDTISISTDFSIDDYGGFTADGIPHYFIIALAHRMGRIEDLELVLNVRVHVKDRPTVRGRINFSLPTPLEIVGLPKEDAVMVVPDRTDTLLFVEAVTGPRLQQWETRVGTYNVLRYSYWANGVARYIRADVNAVPRVAHVDSDGDGEEEFRVWDIDGDGVPDRKAQWNQGPPMLQWKSEAFSDTSGPVGAESER